MKESRYETAARHNKPPPLRGDRPTGQVVVDDSHESLEYLRQLELGLAIDRNALDEAEVRQPDLHYRVSSALQLLISRRDAAKQEIAEAEAEIGLTIRDAAAKVSEKKEKAVRVTEGEINARIAISPRVKDATREFLRLADLVRRYQALESAYSARSYALKDLTTLYASGYFGAERSHDGAQARAAMADARRERGR